MSVKFFLKLLKYIFCYWFFQQPKKQLNANRLLKINTFPRLSTMVATETMSQVAWEHSGFKEQLTKAEKQIPILGATSGSPRSQTLRSVHQCSSFGVSSPLLCSSHLCSLGFWSLSFSGRPQSTLLKVTALLFLQVKWAHAELGCSLNYLRVSLPNRVLVSNSLTYDQQSKKK